MHYKNNIVRTSILTLALVGFSSTLYSNDHQISDAEVDFEFLETDSMTMDQADEIDSEQLSRFFSKISHLQFSAQSGYKSGYLSYQIGGVVSDGVSVGLLPFPLSELRFPLNVRTIRADIALAMTDGWRAKISLEENDSSNAGYMEDSDWGVAEFIQPGAGFDPDSLDIFSRSKSKLSLKEASFQIDKEYRFFKKENPVTSWKSLIGAGISYQEYYFDVYDLVQNYPSLNLPTDRVSGKVLTYLYKQYTPFISATFLSPPSKLLNIAFDLSLSPSAYVFDDDNHILRDKLSSGETKGVSANAGMEISFRVIPKAELFMQLSYQYTATNGWQTQLNNEGGVLTKAKVKQKHFQDQKNIRFGGKLTF